MDQHCLYADSSRNSSASCADAVKLTCIRIFSFLAQYALHFYQTLVRSLPFSVTHCSLWSWLVDLSKLLYEFIKVALSNSQPLLNKTKLRTKNSKLVEASAKGVEWFIVLIALCPLCLWQCLFKLRWHRFICSFAFFQTFSGPPCNKDLKKMLHLLRNYAPRLRNIIDSKSCFNQDTI